ncbi:MAG: LutB/LldF family L-lactate oxidation iron-sulfur protein [Trueperaceae bacterium]
MTRIPLPYHQAASEALGDAQQRANLRTVTGHIRAKRAQVTSELPDWEALREAGERIKDHVLRNLGSYLPRLEERVTAAGGTVHWARDAAEANGIVRRLVAATGEREVVKVKSMTTDEIGLNEALAEDGVVAIETDLAELIVQLAEEEPSHILVPAIHKNRAEIRALFLRAFELDPSELSDDPRALTAAARRFLRARFLDARVGISGANVAVAETGTVGVVESEGNGRMCTTLPDTLITVMGIEKLVPAWRDVEVLLQLLPRSATAERMNPYTSFWTGVHDGDGPEAFHLVLLDAGRSRTLADDVGRATLRCIRCSACLNVCPVYERVGGHAYGSVYPGPIGAILNPQLRDVKRDRELPYASTLCGACYDVCPVRIDIPSILVELRRRVVTQRRREAPLGVPSLEDAALRAAAATFASRRRYEAAQRLLRMGQRPFVRRGGGAGGTGATDGGGDVLRSLPGPLAGWSAVRDLRPLPRRSFRDWWRDRSRS